MSDIRNFRDVLGRYPTGVAIVSAYVEGKAIGVTVNSFASVSLEPPLVLWSIERATDRHGLFETVDKYVINILSSDQAELAKACAMEADLNACNAKTTGTTYPLIEGAVAHLNCHRSATYPGGDHDIIVGEVIDMDAPRDVPSLVFYRGKYGQPG